MTASTLRRTTAPWVGADPGAAPVRVSAVWSAGPDGALLVWAGLAERVPQELWETAVDAPALRLSPALTSHHVHGGAGVDLATSPAADVRSWLAAQRQAGVGAVVGSLPTLTEDALAAALDRLRPLWAEGLLAGVHLEGPFLSPARAGAHDPALLLTPLSPAGRRVRALIAAQPEGFVRTLTLAPELPGTDALTRELTGAGVVVCPGHTDADAATTRAWLQTADDARAAATAAGFPAPTPVATHLFNAMRGFHHRAPGPLPALLGAARAGRARLELIGDGVHVDDEVLTAILGDPGLAPAACLVSDAVAATGATRGTPHRLGSLPIHAAQDGPRVGADEPTSPAEATLAGGAADLPAIVGRLLHSGLDPDAVLRAATHVPARTLGRRHAVPAGAPETTAHAVPGGDVLMWAPDGAVTVLRSQAAPGGRHHD
ncbi:N-acetylglucosamine-6-phosphate deacetylase [Micrococcus porci]|uniref:N-acetylglucosamine-6-phosphate deacetylase n=1 Tax=Micrococcus porci TaxID=2856555 RepID=UPI003CF42B99